MKTLVVYPTKELLYVASTLGGEVVALVFNEGEAEGIKGKAHRVVVANVDVGLRKA